MKCLTALSTIVLMNCSMPIDPPPSPQPEGGAISAPSVIATEDGLHIRDADGSWGFIGMPEPNPPTITNEEGGDD